MELSLEELKAENAREEAELATGNTADSAEEVDLEAAEDESDIDEDAAVHSDDKAESEVEDWMKSDSQESEGSESVPLAAHIKTRAKLKGAVKERDDVIERLKAEMEELKRAQAMPAAQIQTIKPPKPEDYDFDDSRFAEAQAQYIDAQINARLNSVAQKTETEKRQAQFKQQLDESLSNHYARAEKLVKSAGITEEQYQAADTKLRLAIDQVMPKQGDIVADTLLANLGEGSEKVGYWLGCNTSAREELQRKLVSDPSGLSAAMWLGGKARELSAPKQLKSNAPKPNTQLNGDGNTKDPHKALKDKLAKARSSGDMQKVIDLKIEAKKAGIDTKTL